MVTKRLTKEVRPRIYYTNFHAANQKLTSAIAFGKLSDLVKKFSRRGFRLISLRENAWLRISKGRYSPESWTGNYLREGILYFPGRGIFIVKNSPIIDRVDTAVLANSFGDEYKITFAEAESVVKNSVSIPYGLKEIEVAQLHRHPVTKFIFEDSARKYGEFLLEANIDKLPIWTLPKGLVDAQVQPFVRQAILRCMDNWSGIVGSHTDLYTPYGVRFVTSKYHGKIDDADEVYSISEIVQALRSSSLSGLEIPILRALRQSSSLPVNFNEDPFTWGRRSTD